MIDEYENIFNYFEDKFRIKSFFGDDECFNNSFAQMNKTDEKEIELEKLKTMSTSKKKQESESNTPLEKDIIDKIQNKVNGNESLVLNEELINIHETKKTKKILGRKKHNSGETGIHNKYSGDNIIRKIKSCILNTLSIFINFKIMRTFNGNIGQGIFKKQLLKMKQSQIVNGKNDKKFLKKSLKEIFSDDISSKYTMYPVDHNKNLIENLLNEVDYDKRKIFENLFSLTFIDCLNHFRGSENFDVLQGIEKLDDVCKKFENDDEYLELFKYYIFNFEEIVMNKRTRDR